ncbi:DUF2510 domain-containing protein [Protaetiibacter sp. SSC-01]|uniref:DUF2510 domain-containing protein n=1 Tax=Protaetiibacter sp. SSC-01 TaxID=2759943 RepID=UPI001657095F|nr:DUF2510 domain-containing protein [Protaetiibacter sp. SSC-01]QNO37747.1 DUF2510 domain-containing protein [Protaetiibacter sp. SSC-01]
MSHADVAPAAEGWRPDPAHATLERWWDGVAWTEFTRPAPPPPNPLARRIPVRDYVHRKPDPDTRAVAWIAWSPGWITFGLLPLSLLTMASALASLLVPVVAGLAALALLLLARRDARQLYDRGFARRPSVAWMLLTPVAYLFARRRALGEGRAHIVLIAVQLGLIGVGFFIYESITLGLVALSERIAETPAS